MFEALQEAVKELEIPPTGDALREVWRLVDQVTARAREATAEFDAIDGPATEGASSMASWLRHTREHPHQPPPPLTGTGAGP